MDFKYWMLAVVAVLAPSSAADSATIRYDFDGTIVNRFNNGLPDPSDIFGLTVEVGDSVSGSFTIDTDAPVFGSLNGSISGAAAGYTQSPPQTLSVDLAGGVFSSDGVFASSIANDFQDDLSFPPFEQFSVSDGVSSGSADVSGSTIQLNGGSETAQLSLTFTDNDTTAFNSVALPTSLTLADFEIAEGTISGTRPSGNINPFFYQATFQIDSITATAIPEPSTLWASGCFAMQCFVLGWRRRPSSLAVGTARQLKGTS